MGGTLAPKSFTLSQAYYFGSVERNPDHAVELVEGRFIDLATSSKRVLSCPRSGPQRGLSCRYSLPAPNRMNTPNAALDHALTLFESCEEVGRHPTLLAVARMLAPFIKAGLLDAASVMEHVAGAITKSGRRRTTMRWRARLNWRFRERSHTSLPPMDRNSRWTQNRRPRLNWRTGAGTWMRHRFVFVRLRNGSASWLHH